VHPYGARVRPVLLGGTTVRNVTGWHLIDIRPGRPLSEPKGRPAVWTEEPVFGDEGRPRTPAARRRAGQHSAGQHSG
jgi:hypothetical protein